MGCCAERLRQLRQGRGEGTDAQTMLAETKAERVHPAGMRGRLRDVGRGFMEDTERRKCLSRRDCEAVSLHRAEARRGLLPSCKDRQSGVKRDGEAENSSNSQDRSGLQGPAAGFPGK